MLSKTFKSYKDHFLSVKHPIKKILHNSTFRMFFLYLVLFILSSLILLSFIYWSTIGYMYKQLDHHIEYDMERLQHIYTTEGQASLINAIENSLKQRNYESVYLFYNRHNKQLLAGNLSKTPDFSSGWHLIDLSEFTNKTQLHHRTARILVMPLPNNFILINGLDMESVHQQESMIFQSFLTAIIIVFLLGAIGGFIISLSTLKKINLINQTIYDISHGNFSLRIPSRGTDDDYDLLSRNINDMLDKIHKLMHAMKNISNNIAHDLRTPLTRLQGRLESIQKNCSDETSAGIQDALDETDNLLLTFNAMLRINNVESGTHKGHFKPIAIDILLQDAMEFYQPLAEEKDITIVFNSKSDLTINADKDMLFQVFTNLIDNAIKYTSHQGKITIASELITRYTQQYVQVLLSDSGIGIPKSERDKVLEPFYRLEKHRNHPGNGLGLSLVSAIIKSHKGTIEFRDNQPGLKVFIHIPV